MDFPHKPKEGGGGGAGVQNSDSSISLIKASQGDKREKNLNLIALNGLQRHSASAFLICFYIYNWPDLWRIKGKWIMRNKWGFPVSLYNVPKTLFYGLIMDGPPHLYAVKQLIARHCPHIHGNRHRFITNESRVKSQSVLITLIASFHCLLEQSIPLLSKSNYIFTRKVFETLHVFGRPERLQGWQMWWARSLVDYHPSASTRTMGKSRERRVSQAYWRQLKPSNHS